MSTNIVIRNKSKAERDMSTPYQLLNNDDPDWNKDEMPFRSDSTTDLESSSHDDVTKTNDKHPENPSSMNTSLWKSAFNIGNYMEGVGFLALPFAVAKGGVAAIVSLLLVPIILCYSGNILIECFYDDDKKRGRLRTRASFKDLGDVLSPRYGGFLALAGQQLILLLTSISYLIVCGSLLEHSLPSAPLTQATWTVIAGVVVLPTAFLKTLSQIAWLSFVSIVGLTGVVVGVVWYGVEHTDQWDARSLLFWNTKGAILSFSMVVFSNDSIVLLPSVEESMADRSNFSRALYIPYAINTILKVAFSVVAFLSFQFNTDEVIINNLPAGPIRITVSMLFLSSCLLSYALTSYPVIEYLLQTAPIQNISAKISDVLISAAVRITLVLVTVLLAALLPHFALLLSLTSSLLVSLDVFIFPSSVHLKLKYHELKSHQVLLDIFVIGIGAIVCVFGVFVSAESIVETYTFSNKNTTTIL